MPTWDEAKRRRNLREHGLDFVGCEALFDGPVLVSDDDRDAYGEWRQNAIGWLGGSIVRLTYVERGEDLHIISLRRATRHEASRYQEALSNH